MVTATEQRMEWQYYTNPSKKRKIDILLRDAALLFANCGPTKADREEALKAERVILEQISKLDRHFAEQCGYRP